MRYNPDIKIGLTKEQVKMRVDKELNNKNVNIKSKSIVNILKDNLFTLFNIVNLLVSLAIFFIGSYKNLLFLGIVICNVTISIVQELRSKMILDKLSILANNKVNVIRDSKVESINIEDIVLDDIMILKSGNQVVVDCIIKNGNVTVDESYITGEVDSVFYKEGDMIKSGSFILNGYCTVKVEHIKEDNYITVISKDAAYIKPVNSILLKSIKKIIKILSILIFPVGIALFYTQFTLDNNLSDAIINTSAAIIGMLPGGLVLLTSTVLALSVIKLAKLNVLTRDLYSIEALARVDVICFDKTGTLTEGNLELIETVLFDDINIVDIMGNFINAVGVENKTIEALNKEFKEKDNYVTLKKENFNSALKYSSVSFKEGTYKLGAPEVLYKKIKEIEEKQQKNRVLLLTKNDKPVAYFVLKDVVKKSALKIFKYFDKQMVDVKIISGDNPKTVCNIANSIGIEVDAVDCLGLSITEKDVVSNNVFGHVSPIQKKQIVEILQSRGHFVAMTGDGVNDVLALKQADCSISLGSGTDMAKNVSQIVLLDSNYDSITNIINEGRKVVNNLERSATLFLSKNISLMLLSVIFIFLASNYPFQPIHLSLTNFFTIGVPSFLLALQANKDPIKGNLLINILNKSIPTALTIIFNVVMIIVLGNFYNLSDIQISTLSVLLLGYTGFLLLFKLCIPFNKKRIVLLTSLITLFIITATIFRSFFILTLLDFKMLLLVALLVIASTLIFASLIKLFHKIIKKKYN